MTKFKRVSEQERERRKGHPKAIKPFIALEELCDSKDENDIVVCSVPVLVPDPVRLIPGNKRGWIACSSLMSRSAGTN